MPFDPQLCTSRVAARHIDRRAYLEGDPEAKATVAQSLSTLLGLFRAQAINYQTAHWQVGGDPAYGNHLLFERLYESMGGQVDTIAEKMVGYLGVSAVSMAPSVEVMKAWVDKWSSTECPFARGLKSEADCQRVLKQARDAIEASGLMTLGLDDFLAATASEHDTNTYLLQQVLDKSAPGAHA